MKQKVAVYHTWPGCAVSIAQQEGVVFKPSPYTCTLTWRPPDSSSLFLTTDADLVLDIQLL